jgi:hypothetical protein
MSKPNAALEQYRQQLNDWVAALAVADNDAVCADVADGYEANDVHLFTEGNLDKRADILDLQTSFLRPAFDDLDELIGEYVATHPQLAFTAGPVDAATFLRWLSEAYELAPEQADHVACRLARYGVEDAARADRKAHVRFQEKLSVARRLTKSLERGEPVKIHLNPVRSWAKLHTREFLDDQTNLPAEVVFYAVKTEIRSAVLDDPVPSLLETLGDDALTLDEWAERVGLRDSGELLELTKRLAELGVLAFS